MTDEGYRGCPVLQPAPLLQSERGEEGARSVRELATHAQAFASLVALAERSSVLDVHMGWYLNDESERRWVVTIDFNSGDLLDAVADSPEAAVKALEEKMQEREDIQSGLMEDT